MKRIFVQSCGFSDAERHALDSLFRLSESRAIVYAPWTAQSAESVASADVLIIDGDSWEATLALANPAHDELKLVWVGADAPDRAWRVFAAPVRWSAVVEALDVAYAPDPAPHLPHQQDLGVLADEGGDDTEPLPLELASLSPRPRVLLVDAARDERLYLRAKLAVAGLHEVDEAASGSEALLLLNTHAYRLVTVDLGLGDMDPWQLIKAVDHTRPAIAHLLVTGMAPAWQQAWRARLSGAQSYMKKPLHPGQLSKLLRNI